MTDFKNLFGIHPEDAQNTCVLTPFMAKDILAHLNVEPLSKGSAYKCGQSPHFTFIHTNIGALHVGDTLLHLKETKCKNVILLGACGAVKLTPLLDVGSIVTPQICFNYESFSSLIKNQSTAEKSTADQTLVDQLLEHNPDILPVNCASFGSLKMELSYQETLIKQNIDVLDMECSAFLTAAQHCSFNAVGLFYVTDILGKHHVFDKTSLLMDKIIPAQLRCYEVIKSFTENLSSQK